jgi:ribulose-phosphate 3-epimerase
MAIHPDVSLDVASDHLNDLDVLLVMTVRPGFGGQAYLEEVTPKIAAARVALQEASSDADLEVDGGVNLSTVAAPVQAGAEILVAGSAVFDGKDPVAAARRMRERLDELGAGQ